MTESCTLSPRDEKDDKKKSRVVAVIFGIRMKLLEMFIFKRNETVEYSLLMHYCELFQPTDRGVDRRHFWGAKPNLPTEKSSLKPEFPMKNAFLAFEHLQALMMYCKFVEKLNIHCRFSDKPNFGGAAPLEPLWLHPCLPKLLN